MWKGDFFQMWSPSNYAYYINTIYLLVVAALVYVIIATCCTYFCKNIWVRTPTPPFNTTLKEIEHNTVVYKKVHYTNKAPIHIHNTPSCGITLMWPPAPFFYFAFHLSGKKSLWPPPPRFVAQLFWSADSYRFDWQNLKIEKNNDLGLWIFKTMRTWL